MRRHLLALLGAFALAGVLSAQQPPPQPPDDAHIDPSVWCELFPWDPICWLMGRPQSIEWQIQQTFNPF